MKQQQLGDDPVQLGSPPRSSSSRRSQTPPNTPPVQLSYTEPRNENCNCYCCVEQYQKFVNNLQEWRGFLFFNVICIVQTVPALTYYINFFNKGWFLPYTSGMPPVWGATIGAIATVIATFAVGPPLPNCISRSLCVAVVAWEFMCSIMLFIACVCLATLKDFHGFGWSFLGSLSTGCAGVYLIWFSLIYVQDTALDEPHEESFEMESMEAPLPYPHPSPPPFHNAPVFRRNDSNGLLPSNPMPLPMAPPPTSYRMPTPPAPSSNGSSVGTSERDVYITMDPAWEGSGLDSRDNSKRQNNLNIEMENIALSPYRRPSAMRLGIDTALQTVKELQGEETITTDTIPDLTTMDSSKSMALDRLTPKSMMMPNPSNQSYTNSTNATDMNHRPTPSSSSNIVADYSTGFVAHTDPDTGRTFYHNEQTGVSQWHSPEIQRGLPPGYEAHTDASTGQTFYVNLAQGTTSWERPNHTIEPPLPLPPPPPRAMMTQRPDPGVSMFTPVRRTTPLPMGQGEPDMQGPQSISASEGKMPDGRDADGRVLDGKIMGRDGMQQLQRPTSKSLLSQQQPQQPQYPNQPTDTSPVEESKLLGCCDQVCCIIPPCQHNCGDCQGCDCCGNASPYPDDPQVCTCRTVFSMIVFVFVQLLLWTILFVFAVIPFGFGVQSALQAVEAATYPAPGQFYAIPTSLGGFNLVNSVSPAVPSNFLMHIACQGPDLRVYNRPTILLEADNSTSGYSLIGLQSILTGTTRGWRVCWYDRAGYGWSQIAPLGSNTPAIIVNRLNLLLSLSGEGNNQNGFIVVGHGAGAELAQIYAATYPLQVSGLALLDGYSNTDRLLRTANDDIFKATQTICGTYEIGRALESVAIMRAVTDQYNRQTPSSQVFTPSLLLLNYLSTQTNGKYWSAMYNDLCVNKGSATANTDYLTAMGAPGMGRKSITFGGASWVQLKARMPILILSAGNTITGSSATARAMARQAFLYNTTLSPTNTTRWVICTGCDHTFAYDGNTNWVANQLHNYFR